MADGGRFAESGNRRITEDGALRITQHAVLLSATLDGATSLSCTVERFRPFASLHSHASLTCHMTRRRSIGATFIAKASGVSAPAIQHLRLRATLAVQASMQAGYNVFPYRRITEEGAPRATYPPGVRVVEHNPNGGRVLVRRPPFRIYSKDQGVWRIVGPSVMRQSQWQLPKHISVKDGDTWRAVVEPQSD